MPTKYAPLLPPNSSPFRLTVLNASFLLRVLVCSSSSHVQVCWSSPTVRHACVRESPNSFLWCCAWLRASPTFPHAHQSLNRHFFVVSLLIRCVVMFLFLCFSACLVCPEKQIVFPIFCSILPTIAPQPRADFLDFS